jgi:endonuclease/exonuclease/phosphatase family metal-dependent hydrolase
LTLSFSMIPLAAAHRLARQLVLFFSLLPFTVTGGCAHEHGLVQHANRNISEPAVQWFGPEDAADETPLARWRSAVGPPLIREGETPSNTRTDELTVVSWNTAVGAGDLRRFVAELPHSPPMVLLLQEVYRGGEEVPGVLPAGGAYAGRLGGRPGDSGYEYIEPMATALGLSLFYVPSMRNGGAGSREDRGNAILSSLPLSDLAAYELPFERQRRVALAATISGTSSTGKSWRLRIVDAHLDNTFSPRRLWLASEYGRTRQARSLVATLDTGEPLILGGDFNTWSGFSDQAYLTLARRFPAVRPSDRRPTFRGVLRLDHLFFRLEPEWSATFRRADERFRSDHYPLIGTVRFRR